jgi:hypothetical protein
VHSIQESKPAQMASEQTFEGCVPGSIPVALAFLFCMAHATNGWNRLGACERLMRAEARGKRVNIAAPAATASIFTKTGLWPRTSTNMSMEGV